MAALNVKAAEEPTFDEMKAWLTEQRLLDLSIGLSEEQAVHQYNALSKCAFGNAVGEESQHSFLCRLLPYEAHLATK